MRDWIGRHRKLTVIGVVGAALLTVFVFVWFEPHKAFIDERVDETIPVAVATTEPPPTVTTQGAMTTAPDATTSTPPAVATTTTTSITYPVVRSQTSLVGVAHGGSGTVLGLELEDGSSIIRFEDLDVLNGPDLVVILSDRTVTGADDYADGEYVILDELKGNQGNQNYAVPDDVSLQDWRSVAIWCRRFNTTFNAADLEF